MNRFVLLDAGPLGLVTGPGRNPEANGCRDWLEDLLAAGVEVRVPDIADYEVRRELLRARRFTGIRHIDHLRARIGYLAVTTETLFLAAEFWARLRQQGLPTADKAALDSDVILAAQAALLLDKGHSVVVATTNVGHLARLVPADLWQHITGEESTRSGMG
jgi:predicted nucleic acid-binding protein